MPSSTACRKRGSLSLSSRDQGWLPRLLSPKLMQPSAILLTLRPDWPRRVYSMAEVLPLGGLGERLRPPPRHVPPGLPPRAAGSVVRRLVVWRPHRHATSPTARRC